MRWYALDVDYEMSGKDLIDSVRLSGRICRILGSTPPEGFTYELFLDEHAQKISKSKGNGLSVEEWLRYAPPESLSQFMFNAPQRAKRLYFDVIPRAVDEYLANAARLADAAAGGADAQSGLAHPRRPSAEPWRQPGLVRHAAQPRLGGERRHAGDPVGLHPPLQPGRDARRRMPFLDRLVDHAIAYYRDFVRPEKRYRHPTDLEREALADLAETLKGMDPAPMPRRSRPSSTRSASAIRSPNCAPGSAASIRCCLASRKARGSVASSRLRDRRRRSR